VKLEPIVFGPADAPLFGIVTPATPSAAIDRGVVICAPVGYENVLHYRHLRVLARRLGETGRATLRFDWPECGDSSGDDRETGLVASWTRSVSDAAATLRERTGVAVVDVIGVRIGATLAALATAGDPAIGDLVLWAPFPSGRSYIREMRAFHRLAENTLPSRRNAEAEVDGQEISGFLLASTTLADLDQVDLLSTQFASRARRVLVAGRDARPDEALVRHLRSQDGHVVDTAVLRGLEDVALSWSDAPIPTDAFQAIEDWLPKGNTLPQNGKRPTARDGAMTLSLNGLPIREQAVVLGDEDPLVGVMCTPGEDSSPAASDAWVVFLSNRYARRIGPNRLYTSYARRWATQGIRSLRLDVSATGDSGGPEQETVRNMYSEQVVADAREALAYLRAEHGARRFVFVGLCSGAFTGFHAALAEPDVEGVVLIGVHLLVWTEDETAMTLASNLRRTAFRMGSWQRLMRGQVPVRKVTFVAVTSALLAIKRQASLATHRLLRREHSDPVGTVIKSALAELSRRGCSLLFVFPDADPGLSYLRRYLGDELKGLADQPTFRIEEIHGTDHTFRPFWSHGVLREKIEGELLELGYFDAENGQRADVPEEVVQV
jgi:pimeloyl-ACP methyl ester carboxylesterase